MMNRSNAVIFFVYKSLHFEVLNIVIDNDEILVIK